MWVIPPASNPVSVNPPTANKWVLEFPPDAATACPLKEPTSSAKATVTSMVAASTANLDGKSVVALIIIELFFMIMIIPLFLPPLNRDDWFTNGSPGHAHRPLP